MMIWAYAKGHFNIHLFNHHGEDDFYTGACGEVKVFSINQVEPNHLRSKDVCFGCLLAYIQKAEAKP
jgi:hypothetical protein